MSYCEAGKRCQSCPVALLPVEQQPQAQEDIANVLRTYDHSLSRRLIADGSFRESVESVMFPSEEALDWIYRDEERPEPRDPDTSNVEVVMGAIEMIVTGKHDTLRNIG